MKGCLQVLRSRFCRVTALVLLVSIAFTLALGGCGPKETATAPDEGEEVASGGDEGGGGASGGDDVGGDGPGGGRWEPFAFEPGQYFKYEVQATGDEPASGWFSLNVADAGGGRMELHFEGELSGEFSLTATITTGDVSGVVMPLMMSHAGWALLPLFMNPWELWFAGQALDVGTRWSFTAEGETMTFAVTGTETYAGVTGYVCEWTVTGSGGEHTLKVCVNPEFPLILYGKIGGNGDYFEYTLVEQSGF